MSKSISRTLSGSIPASLALGEIRPDKYGRPGKRVVMPIQIAQLPRWQDRQRALKARKEGEAMVHAQQLQIPQVPLTLAHAEGKVINRSRRKAKNKAARKARRVNRER